MRNILHLCFGIILTSAAIAGCGASPDNTEGGVPGLKNRVRWASIPAEFNPQTSDITFNTNGADTVRMNIFGFAADVEVIYSANVPAGQAYLRTYTVSKNATTWSPINSTLSNQAINLTAYGTYSCKIKIENGKITELDGGCYVRMQVLLPADSDLAVYNLNQLISTKARLTTVEELITNIHNTTWVGDKRRILYDFLQSYEQAGKQPVFTSLQVGRVIHEFDLTADKLKILRRLNVFVSDRQNLSSMIDREFPEHARGEARVAAGLNLTFL